MADQKVSDLPSLNGADVDAADLLYIVDSSAGTAGSKKITVGQYQLAPYSAGTANGVMYLNGSNVMTTGSGLVFDGTNLGVGTSSPATKLDVNGSAIFGSSISTGRGVSTGDANIEIGGLRSGDGPSFIDFHSTSGTDYESRLIRQSGVNGRLEFQNTGTGEMWMLQTGAAGINFFTNNTERARITSGGDLLVGTTSNTEGYKQKLVGTQAAASLGVWNNQASGNFDGQNIYFGGSAPNNGTSRFLYCNDTAGTRFSALSNGGLANYQANDVNLSDRREKTNFAPAKSYLDAICAIPVQTFNYIDQNLEEDPGLTLGVVAQDVQAVAPELVKESNWGTEDEPKVRLSVYQTDLQYALMKCIQEQQALINDLRARVAALEAQ